MSLTLTDTYVHADGTPANGTVSYRWATTFFEPSGHRTVVGEWVTARLATDGTVSITLDPPATDHTPAEQYLMVMESVSCSRGWVYAVPPDQLVDGATLRLGAFRTVSELPDPPSYFGAIGPQGPKGDKGDGALVDEGDVNNPPPDLLAGEFLYDPNAQPNPGYTALTQDQADARYAQVTAIDPTTGRLAIGGMEIGHTSRRSIASLLVNGWTGNLYVARSGNVVTVATTGLQRSAANADTFVTLPVGFRPQSNAVGSAEDSSLATGTALIRATVGTCDLRRSRWTSPNTQVWFTATYTTNDPWPTTLPGIPA